MKHSVICILSQLELIHASNNLLKFHSYHYPCMNTYSSQDSINENYIHLETRTTGCGDGSIPDRGGLVGQSIGWVSTQIIHDNNNYDNRHFHSRIKREREREFIYTKNALTHFTTLWFEYLKHCFKWLRDLDTKKIETEVFGELWNVVLEKNGQDKMVRGSN